MISEKIGNFYASLEDKWYSFVDSIEAKGIPLGKYADFLDNHGIPSFPFTIMLIILIIAGIVEGILISIL